MERWLDFARLRLTENAWVWRHVLNRRATREFRQYEPRLGDEARRMLQSLNAKGYAISHVSRFRGMTDQLDSLRAAATRAETSSSWQAERRRSPEAYATGYAITSNVLGSYPKLDPTSALASFSTQRELLDIINSYFGMFSQLRKYAVFRTRAVKDGVNAKWHRDGALDLPIVRVFVYFSAVTDSNGAFLYAPETHGKSSLGSRRPIPDTVLDERAVTCAGPAGTLILADTRGYHRAGTFSSGERWVYNSIFTSPGLGRDYFIRTGRTRPRSLDPVAWALSSPLNFLDNFLYR
jgi:hypothetical protein